MNQSEQKQIKDYLRYYLGQECETPTGQGTLVVVGDHDRGEDSVVAIENTIPDSGNYGEIEYVTIDDPKDIKPILRNLEDMTEEDMIGLLEAMVPHDMEDKPAADDFDVELFHNDGGNLVDSDVVIGAEYTCRCYVGQIAIRHNGDIDVYEDGDRQKVINYPQAFHYLLSKGFDLFGLIPASLAAIDSKNAQP